MIMMEHRAGGAVGTPRGRLRIVGGVLLESVALLASGCLSAQRAAEIELAAAQRSTLVGRPAPDFTLPDQDDRPVRLRDARGHWVVIYFYPADGTAGCTCQAQEFTRSHRQFQRLNAWVYGISPDSVASHKAVTDAFKLTVPLLSDPDHAVMTAYGAWAETAWGARAMRSTVMIDPDGRVAWHWPEVIPEGHAERVRAKLAELQQRTARAQPADIAPAAREPAAAVPGN
jgi:peroxiredoxin Q/BCP